MTRKAKAPCSILKAPNTQEDQGVPIPWTLASLIVCHPWSPLTLSPLTSELNQLVSSSSKYMRKDSAIKMRRINS